MQDLTLKIKSSEFNKIVKQLKELPSVCVDSDKDYPCYKYVGKFNGIELNLYVHPKTSGIFGKGWELLYKNETIASKEGREGIDVKISNDRVNLLFNGRVSFDDEKAQLEAQLESIKNRIQRVENLQYFGFGNKLF